MAKAGMFIEDLKVGQTGEMTKTVTERDIQMFAEVSSDTNPVHLDEAYAKTTMFKTRIAHGMLGAAFISAVFGTVMPGPGITVPNTAEMKAAPSMPWAMRVLNIVVLA